MMAKEGQEEVKKALQYCLQSSWCTFTLMTVDCEPETPIKDFDILPTVTGVSRQVRHVCFHGLRIDEKGPSRSESANMQHESAVFRESSRDDWPIKNAQVFSGGLGTNHISPSNGKNRRKKIIFWGKFDGVK